MARWAFIVFFFLHLWLLLTLVAAALAFFFAYLSNSISHDSQMCNRLGSTMDVCAHENSIIWNENPPIKQSKLKSLLCRANDRRRSMNLTAQSIEASEALPKETTKSWKAATRMPFSICVICISILSSHHHHHQANEWHPRRAKKARVVDLLNRTNRWPYAQRCEATEDNPPTICRRQRYLFYASSR